MCDAAVSRRDTWFATSTSPAASVTIAATEVGSRTIHARAAAGVLTVDPGAHTLLVSAPGHVAERRELRLAPSERYVFQTTLRREPTPHPPTQSDARPITSRWWFWTLVGGVVVAGVTATLVATLSTTEAPVPGTRLNVEAIESAGR